MIDETLEVCKRIKNDRTVYDVLASINSELGELAEEIRIKYGSSYKKPGVDGIFGEGIDVILCVIDILYVDNPNISKDDIISKVTEKLTKWEKCENEKNS